LPLKCPFGSIGEIYSFGVTPRTASRIDYCAPSTENQACTNLVTANFEKSLNDCKEKQNCTIKFDAKTLFGHENTVIEDCAKGDSILFVQHSCLQSSQILEQKGQDATAVACFGIFSCLLFLVILYYIK